MLLSMRDRRFHALTEQDKIVAPQEVLSGRSLADHALAERAPWNRRAEQDAKHERDADHKDCEADDD